MCWAFSCTQQENLMVTFIPNIYIALGRGWSPRSGAKDLKQSAAYPRKYGKAVAKHHQQYIDPWFDLKPG